MFFCSGDWGPVYYLCYFIDTSLYFRLTFYFHVLHYIFFYLL